MNTSNPPKSPLRSLINLAFWVFMIHSFGIASFYVPSGSMIPTFYVGDHLLASKFTYGFSRFSLPLGYMLPSWGRVLAWSSPQRGDVIIFKDPTQSHRKGVNWVKRVVGLPGDKIQVIEGKLYINGQPCLLTSLGKKKVIAESKGASIEAWAFEETFPDGHRHTIFKTQPLGENLYDDTLPYTVPPGHYFVMGDNRDNSHDSRSASVRFIPAENIVGRAEFIFLSKHDSQWQFWRWLWDIRYARWPHWVR